VQQFAPNVSDADVERILKREVPLDKQAEIREIVARLEVREKRRVVVACLKNARRDMSKLKEPARRSAWLLSRNRQRGRIPQLREPPLHLDRLSERERQDIVEKDKQQYLACLHGDAEWASNT
jgi:hypothetical protein